MKEFIANSFAVVLGGFGKMMNFMFCAPCIDLLHIYWAAIKCSSQSMACLGYREDVRCYSPRRLSLPQWRYKRLRDRLRQHLRKSRMRVPALIWGWALWKTLLPYVTRQTHGKRVWSMRRHRDGTTLLTWKLSPIQWNVRNYTEGNRNRACERRTQIMRLCRGKLAILLDTGCDMNGPLIGWCPCLSNSLSLPKRCPWSRALSRVKLSAAS